MALYKPLSLTYYIYIGIKYISRIKGKNNIKSKSNIESKSNIKILK